MTNPLYRAELVGKVYGDSHSAVPALTDASFSIRAGCFLAIVGPSGSGKSTLLNVLGLLDNNFGGTLLYDNVDITTLSEVQLARVRNKEIGLVFQSYQLLPRNSAIENVELPLLYSGIGARARRERAEQALRRVGLEHRRTHLPAQLSGGEQQRVAIARAIVNDPKVILADEPTGSLDSVSGEAVVRLLEGFNQSGTTVIVVTHSTEVASRAAQRIVMKDGQVIHDQG